MTTSKTLKKKRTRKKNTKKYTKKIIKKDKKLSTVFVRIRYSYYLIFFLHFLAGYKKKKICRFLSA